MKKVLSSILAITMLISALGSVTVFADVSEPNDSSVTATKGYVGLAKDYVVSKAKSAIKNANENKGKYAIVAGGAILSAAAAVAAMYYCKGSDSASAAENLNDSKLGQSKLVTPDLDTKAGTEALVDSATGIDIQSIETINLASGAELSQSQPVTPVLDTKAGAEVPVDGAKNIPSEENQNPDSLSQSQLAIPAPSLKYYASSRAKPNSTKTQGAETINPYNLNQIDKGSLTDMGFNAKNASAIIETGNDEQELDTEAELKDVISEDLGDNYITPNANLSNSFFSSLWGKFNSFVVLPAGYLLITGIIAQIADNLLFSSSYKFKQALVNDGFEADAVSRILACINPKNMGRVLGYFNLILAGHEWAEETLIDEFKSLQESFLK
ncbi:MAG: hypothetical protein RUMPE_00069 [Eubacteriales bacterium SKADARSKE-1]|nr:hypothetical protein [Eubacteriales bacterium SKADARSKE-1]